MAQEALMRAWRMRRSCRSDDPSAWLRQIARNESLRANAREPNHADLDDVAEAAEDDEDVEGLPERLDLDAVLRGLDPLDRRLLAMRYGADMTQPKIAELLGMPEGTVKVRLHRARRALAEGMEER
jgi:RNA polymerase sigma-70 factor, ECF subfamily